MSRWSAPCRSYALGAAQPIWPSRSGRCCWRGRPRMQSSCRHVPEVPCMLADTFAPTLMCGGQTLWPRVVPLIRAPCNNSFCLTTGNLLIIEPFLGHRSRPISTLLMHPFKNPRGSNMCAPFTDGACTVCAEVEAQSACTLHVGRGRVCLSWRPA